MAKQQPVVPSKEDKQKPGSAEITPDWEKVLYTTERVQKWMAGELTLQELNAINGPEMLSMAMIGFQLYEQGKLDEARVVFLGLNGRSGCRASRPHFQKCRIRSQPVAWP